MRLPTPNYPPDVPDLEGDRIPGIGKTMRSENGQSGRRSYARGETVSKIGPQLAAPTQLADFSCLSVRH